MNNFQIMFKRASSMDCGCSSGSGSNIVGGIFNIPQLHKFDPMNLSIIFACLERISNAISQLPIVVKEHKKDAVSVVKGHDISNLFYESNITKTYMMKRLVLDIYIKGNAYLYIKRKNGKPVKLIYMEPGTCIPIINKQRQEVYYQNRGYDKNLIPEKIKQQDMIHIFMHADTPYFGKSIFEYATKSTELASYIEGALMSFYKSGCAIRGVLSFTGAVSDEQKLYIRDNWHRIHGDIDGSTIAVLEGDAHYQPITQGSGEAQMYENRKYQDAVLCRWFNMTPLQAGVMEGTAYGDIESSNLDFVSRVLMPVIALFEDEFNRKLFDAGTDKYSLDIDETFLLRGKMLDLANYVGTLTDKGIMKPDEARDKIGLNPVTGGDELHIAYSDAEQNTIGNNEDDKDEDKSKDSEDENA